MSGFLQRITGSAIRRQNNLHPLVAPVYAAARRDEASLLQFQEEAQKVAVPPAEYPAGRAEAPDAQRSPQASPQRPLATPIEEARGMRSQSTQKSTAAKHAGLQEDPSTHVDSGLNQTGSEGFQPLLARLLDSPREAGAVSGPPSEGVSAESAARTNTTSWPSRDLSSASDSRLEAPAVPRAWEYEPLIAGGTPIAWQAAGTADGPRPGEPARIASEAQTASQRAAARQTLSSNASQTRLPIQAEDIQIHIGRIEVIAVPQPAARPVAAPARRGQTLDEYLRSSNGRSR